MDYSNYHPSDTATQHMRSRNIDPEYLKWPGFGYLTTESLADGAGKLHLPRSGAVGRLLRNKIPTPQVIDLLDSISVASHWAVIDPEPLIGSITKVLERRHPEGRGRVRKDPEARCLVLAQGVAWRDNNKIEADPWRILLGSFTKAWEIPLQIWTGYTLEDMRPYIPKE